MRFGRIILAILAPLVSLTALKLDLASAGKAVSADSLAGLLRAVAPKAAVSAAEGHSVAGAHSPQPAARIFEFHAPLPLATRSPATEATLRFLARQRHHSLLRC